MKPQSLRQRLRESTWIAIVDAAESIGASGGLAAMTLQSVAQEAGIAVGTIYNYFTDRSELIEALFLRRREEFFTAVDAAAKAHAKESFEEQLDAFVRAVLKYFDSRRAYLRLALEASEHHQPAMVKGNDGKMKPTTVLLLSHAERVVRVGTKEKRLREEGAYLFPTALIALLKGVLVARVDEAATLESQTGAIVSLFLHGVSR